MPLGSVHLGGGDRIWDSDDLGDGDHLGDGVQLGMLTTLGLVTTLGMVTTFYLYLAKINLKKMFHILFLPWRGFEPLTSRS